MEAATSSDLTCSHPFAQAGANTKRCEALSKEIATLAGHLNAATHRFLKLIAEFDARNGWNEEGCQSCAHWLHWKCGLALNAAREKVRTAHAQAVKSAGLRYLAKSLRPAQIDELRRTWVQDGTDVLDPSRL